MTNLEIFTNATIEALYFTDTGDIDQPDSDMELDNETRLDLEADCRSFWSSYGCFIINEDGQTIEKAGHDFWFTRNGHGVGFWEGHWPVYGDILDKGSKNYGEFQTYLGDDGKIYA